MTRLNAIAGFSFVAVSAVVTGALFYRDRVALRAREREIQAEDFEKSINKMLKNSSKAITESRNNLQENGNQKSISFLAEETDVPDSAKTLFSSLDPGQKTLSITMNECAEQGRRKSMEDAHFVLSIPKLGMLAGLFDGHGGSKVAQYASKQFEKRFEKTLQEHNGNVHQAFNCLFEEIHKEAYLDKKFNSMGSTAVVSFVDTAKGLIYTATLGDSEIKIYRNLSEKMKVIPLSCVRNWKSEKDKKRAAIAFISLNNGKMFGEVTNEWGKLPAKELRFPFPGFGVNVSRAIGDKLIIDFSPERSAMSHKPKITVSKVLPGDTLVMGCDGLWDFVSDSKIIQNLSESSKETDLANRLVQCAINECRSTDNVSVLVFKIS